MPRSHKSIADTRFCRTNGFENGILIRDTHLQHWIPNSGYLSSSRGDTLHDEALNLIQFWFDHVSADSTHQFSAQLRTPVLLDSVPTHEKSSSEVILHKLRPVMSECVLDIQKRGRQYK